MATYPDICQSGVICYMELQFSWSGPSHLSNVAKCIIELLKNKNEIFFLGITNELFIIKVQQQQYLRWIDLEPINFGARLKEAKALR